MEEVAALANITYFAFGGTLLGYMRTGTSPAVKNCRSINCNKELQINHLQ